MRFDNHTIYFDITQYCNVGCDFCMYSNKHSNQKLQLSELARANISRMFSWNSIKRVSISGEGEPLTNLDTFWDILARSPGGIHFEFITSGASPTESLLRFYTELEERMVANKDWCNIRLSTDSFHYAQVPFRPHLNSLNFFLKNHPSRLSLSFRSIDIDRTFVRNFLNSEVRTLGLVPVFEDTSLLDEVLHVDSFYFPISYKNLVHPRVSPGTKYMTLNDYMGALEQKYSRPFTFGALNPWPQSNGLDITIKPDGTVIFYGVDILPLANIHKDSVDFDFFLKTVEQNSLVRDLYTIPFREFIKPYANEANYAEIIQKANNPYWVLSELAAHNQALFSTAV